MTQLELNPQSIRCLAGVATMLLLTLGAVFTFDADAVGPIPIGAQDGPWLNAVSAVDCSESYPGTVCAEWPSQSNNTITVCCVDPADVGTFQGVGESCTVMIGQRAFY